MGIDAHPKLLRVVDANFNRAKEGLRVCEDVCRFLLDDAKATKEFKNIRHLLTAYIAVFAFKNLMASRDVKADSGRQTIKAESRRKSTSDIFYANCQRVKESLRVLEEFSKLKDVKVAAKIKNLRYQVYIIEKKVLGSRGFDAT